MPNVRYTREELEEVIPLYDVIRDVIAGQKAVKDKTVAYLPLPNNEVSAEDTRYLAYLQRAVFYNVTARTLEGLTGQVFLRDPVIEIPTDLEPMLEDANGNGINFTQLSKAAVSSVMAYGRGGLFTDFPVTDMEVTRANIRNGFIQPTINFYQPWDIINWRTTKIGAKNVLSLVVLREQQIIEKDFDIEVHEQYRVLRLVEIETGFVSFVEVWRKIEGEEGLEGEFAPIDRYVLLDSDGQPLNELPFDFIGAKNNDDQVDKPPLIDMANINIAHYRNSADYEESAFMVGQPTPYFSGVTKDWVDTVWKKQVILGSRSAVPLPERGTAGLIQAESNTMAFEAMEHKEKQMVAIGAKLVQERRIERTATETEIDSASENSTLSTVAKNVTTAFQKSLERAAAYVGKSNEEIKFELNTNFDLTSMTAEELRTVLEAWVADAVTTSEMREALRRSGLASLPDDDYESEVMENKTLKDALNPMRNQVNQRNVDGARQTSDRSNPVNS